MGSGSCFVDGFIGKKILGWAECMLGLFDSDGSLLQLGSMTTFSSCRANWTCCLGESRFAGVCDGQSISAAGRSHRTGGVSQKKGQEAEKYLEEALTAGYLFIFSVL